MALSPPSVISVVCGILVTGKRIPVSLLISPDAKSSSGAFSTFVRHRRKVSCGIMLRYLADIMHHVLSARIAADSGQNGREVDVECNSSCHICLEAPSTPDYSHSGDHIVEVDGFKQVVKPHDPHAGNYAGIAWDDS